ncbi:B12-binding domain-containing radical SAM protein [bacterium]|nr:B12-binding domain-containing radical SAM protein [bacterium]
MRILFVVIDYLTTPMGVLYLSSIAKRMGHEVDVTCIHLPSFVNDAREFEPDVIGYGIVTGSHNPFIEINRKLKEYIDFQGIFGGSHCTFFPEVIHEDGVDSICRGEAEEAFADYLNVLDTGESPEKIDNWWFKKNGKIIENPLRALNEDLDSIPFPDRDLFRRFGNLRNEKTAFVITTRGCPYNCSYCFQHAFREMYQGKGKLIRSRSVDNVLDEVQEIKEKFPLQLVIFIDDTFNLDEEWLREFSEKYPTKIGLPYHCLLRGNLVTENVVRYLSSSGCVSVKMAIESADDDLRNGVLNRGISKEKLLNAASLIKGSKMKLLTQNILGIPGGSLEKDLETLKMNITIKPSYLFATLMQVYPKTKICEYAKKTGVYDGDTSSIPQSFFHRSVLKIPDKEKIERLRMLFALVVELPFLFRIIHFLIRLPLDKVYDLADRLWKGFCLKRRIFPYRLTPKEYIRSVIIYLKANYY